MLNGTHIRRTCMAPLQFSEERQMCGEPGTVGQSIISLLPTFPQIVFIKRSTVVNQAIVKNQIEKNFLIL
jgi:hypothetical protein